MPDSLPALKTVRAQLLRRITTCGDMRRGSISAFTRKCGRANCHCAQSGCGPWAAIPFDPQREGQDRHGDFL